MFEEIIYNVPKSYLSQEGTATPGINSVLLALCRVAEQVYLRGVKCIPQLLYYNKKKWKNDRHHPL